MSSGAAVTVTILSTAVCNKINNIITTYVVFLLSYVCILFSLHNVILFIVMQASATALMMAIYHGLSGVIEALLRAKPDVNISATGVRLCHTSTDSVFLYYSELKH